MPFSGIEIQLQKEVSKLCCERSDSIIVTIYITDQKSLFCQGISDFRVIILSGDLGSVTQGEAY